MGKTLEARLFGKDNMILDVWYYCYAHVAYAMLCAYGVMHMIGYATLCTDDAMYMLDMQCYVQMVLRTCCTCGTMYILCCLHDYTSGVVW